MGASCPHGLEAEIIHWCSLRNVRSPGQSAPKLGAETNPIGPWLSEQKETVEVPRNRRFCLDVCSSSPRAHLYRGKCRSVWAKSEINPPLPPIKLAWKVQCPKMPRQFISGPHIANSFLGHTF
jgi:hypothetical protein